MSQVSRAAIYVRWSTEDQGAGTTLEVQLDACRAYLQSQGWSHRPELVFIDDGVSGGTMERPALTRLREAVRRGEVDCVVVYKLDRLSRSLLDTVKLALEEWEGRCSIKSAREPIDTLTPTGKLFFYQLLSFAEWERSVIRDRMFAGKVRRAQEGRNPGISLPFGYRWAADGSIAADAALAPIVRRMFRLYLSGLGCRSIARLLHEEGVSAPTGGRWTQASLGYLLANPAYAGRWVYGKRATRDGRRVAAAEPLVVRDGFFPALIKPAEFAAVQRLRAERPGVRRSQGSGRSLASRSLLGGLLRCRCGSACIGRAGARGSGGYYLCGGLHRSGAHTCAAGCLDRRVLDEHVAERLRDGYGRRLGPLLRESLAVRRREAEAARESAQRELRRAVDQVRRLGNLLLASRLTAEEYRPLREQALQRLQTARANGRLAAQALRSAQAALAWLRAGGEPGATAGAAWEALTPAERKQVLRHFAVSIRVFRPKGRGDLLCELLWRWPAPRPAERFRVDRNALCTATAPE